jgi:hypothetical protein
MSPEPRQRDDYGQRQIEAAHRVLVDLGQVLACFKDSLVVVGGWTPDLLLPDAEERHIGSIDVDLALDASKLGEGLYAELIQLLLDTRRYRPGEKEFQLAVDVDLEDGGKPVLVEVDFLAAQNVKWKKNKPKLLEGFRVLKAEGCNVAFHAPVEITIPGRNVRGAANTVHMRVVSLADFVLMKAHAIGGRDKPKDVYDLCYAVEGYPGGIGSSLDGLERTSVEQGCGKRRRDFEGEIPWSRCIWPAATGGIPRLLESRREGDAGPTCL